MLTESSSQSEGPRPVEVRTEFAPANTALAYHIVAVYVAPEVRSRGLARKLMRSALSFVEQESKARRFNQAICTVSVSEGIVVARKMYERMGFVAVAKDRYTSSDGRELHEAVMRKDLTY